MRDVLVVSRAERSVAPLPDAPDDDEGRDVDSPARAFVNASCACASAACLVWSVWVRSWVSSDARVWPAVTVSPTSTATDATVPLTGNATVACETGSMVATPFWSESTLRVATVATR